ncbi:MAG TPA: glycine cleavage system protein GcvH [Fimbriimonadaceae bacterium]
MNVPSDLKYTKSHEWVRVESGVATIGITDYAQSELGDVVFVETPPVSKTVAAGESLGTIESVKTVSDLYAPVGGTVTEINSALASKSELLNEDPYGLGWIVKIKLDGSGDGHLMDAAEYSKSIEQ